MTEVLETHRRQVAELCRRVGVHRLDVFGSAARGEFDPESSDLDILVELDAVPPARYAAAYFALKEGWKNSSGARSTSSPNLASATLTFGSVCGPNGATSMHADARKAAIGDLPRVVGFRNVLIHGNATVDDRLARQPTESHGKAGRASAFFPLSYQPA